MSHERQEGRWITVLVILAALLGALLAIWLVYAGILHPLALLVELVSRLAS